VASFSEGLGTNGSTQYLCHSIKDAAIQNHATCDGAKTAMPYPACALCISWLMLAGPAAAATVISVGDGDTLRVEDGGRKVTIRLACIDPRAAAGRLHGHTEGEARDRYGRTVAEVFTQSGTNAGLDLVQQGHTFAYRQYLKQGNAWA